MDAAARSQAPGVGAWLCRNAVLMVAGVYPVLLALYWAALLLVDGGAPRRLPTPGEIAFIYVMLFPSLVVMAIVYVPLAMVIGYRTGRRGRLVVVSIGILIPALLAATVATDIPQWLLAMGFLALPLIAMGSMITLSASEPLGWRRWLLAALPVMIAVAGVGWVIGRF